MSQFKCINRPKKGGILVLQYILINDAGRSPVKFCLESRNRNYRNAMCENTGNCTTINAIPLRSPFVTEKRR